MTAPFNLQDHGVTVAEIHRNLPPSALYEHAIRYEKDASIAENGALVAYSGVKTGRSPKDKRVVEHPASKNDIWWDWEISRAMSVHFKSTASVRSIISTPASDSTASTGSRAGIRSIESKCASSAPVH